jgi:hypothetical protein
MGCYKARYRQSTRGAKETGYEEQYHPPEPEAEEPAQAAEADYRHRPGGQDESLLRTGRGWRNHAGGKRAHQAPRAGGDVWAAGAAAHCHGSGDALAVGEPAAGELGTRGDRSQRATTEADHRQQPQVRPAGRAHAGADGARGPAAVAADPPSQRAGAVGPGQDPCTRAIGGNANRGGQQCTRAGQGAGRAAAQRGYRATAPAVSNSLPSRCARR